MPHGVAGELAPVGAADGDGEASTADIAGTTAATAALPVAVLAAGRDAEGIRGWVEGVLGWQPVERGADRLVPPAVELRDLDSPGEPDRDVPTVLIVDDDAAGERVARVAARVVPDAVLGWPSGRDQLVQVVTEVLGRRPAAARPARRLRVGGSAGGVGTTTVALALAGLSAWSGARTFAALRGTGLPARGLPAAALSTPDLWSRAEAVAGVAALRAVVVADGGEVPDLVDDTIEATLVDAGVDADVDVLVCRPDAAALAMVPATTAAVVVVVGDGPAPPRDLERAAGGRRSLRLPWSVRVARAGYQGRVPAGLPGAWLAHLEPLVPRSGTSRRRRRTASRDADRQVVHSSRSAGHRGERAT